MDFPRFQGQIDTAQYLDAIGGGVQIGYFKHGDRDR
jgi:hypothetical protein